MKNNMRKILAIAVMLASSIAVPVFGQSNVFRNDQDMDVTPTTPYDISSGACWEAVHFTDGSFKNDFQTVSTPNGGLHINWHSNMNLTDGIGDVTGMSYSMKENFHYNFNMEHGQYTLPQHMFFHLVRSDGKVFNIRQDSHVSYDPTTGMTKVLVDKYEVTCP